MYTAKSDLIKEKVQELMCDLWQSKFHNTEYEPVERNIFEENIKQTWDTIVKALEGMVEIGEINDKMANLEEENDDLINENADLIDRNYTLTEENERLKEILHNVIEAVNVTWS